MTAAKFLFLFPVLIACITNDRENPPLHSNSYYSVYSSYNEKTYKVDSIIVRDKKGKRSTYALNQNGIGDYPGLYKDRLISLIYGTEYTNLLSFSLNTRKVDTLCSNIQFLETSSIDEYDGIIIIRDTDKYGIVNVEKKQLVKESDCFLENILLVDSCYFLVRMLNDVSEPKPFLCRGTILGSKDIKLTDLPGMGTMNYEDATTHGWNGMAVRNGILFIHMMQEIVAYDIKANQIADKIHQERIITYRSVSNPLFIVEKEKITFDMKSKRFKQL